MKLGQTLCVQRNSTAMFVFSFPLRFNAFHPDTRKPMHRECGFIRLKPDTNKVAFISAQNTGTASLGKRRGPCPAVPFITLLENYGTSLTVPFCLFSLWAQHQRAASPHPAANELEPKAPCF